MLRGALALWAAQGVLLVATGVSLGRAGRRVTLFAVATAVLCFGSAPVLVVASGRWLSAALWCAIGCSVLLARWVAVDVRARYPTAGTGRSRG